MQFVCVSYRSVGLQRPENVSVFIFVSQSAGLLLLDFILSDMRVGPLPDSVALPGFEDFLCLLLFVLVPGLCTFL